ncbi:MAG: cell division protein ZapA [Sandaracinaceae bacterium]
MGEKRTVTVEIGGARYRWVSDASAERLRALAALVNDRLASLGPRGARGGAEALAMVALGLAEDLLLADDQRRRLEAHTRATVGEALAHLDDYLASAPGEDDGADRLGPGNDDPRPERP